MCWMTVLVYIAFEMERVVQEGARDRSAVGSVTSGAFDGGLLNLLLRFKEIYKPIMVWDIGFSW